MCRVGQRLLNLVDSEVVVWNVLLVLGVDGINLPVGGRLREERTAEELTESVQSSTQVVRADIKIEVGVVTAGEGVETSAMLTQELAPIVLVLVFLRP